MAIRRKLIFPLAASISFVSCCALAQSAAVAAPAAAAPTFDVASIHVNKGSGDGRHHIYSSPNDSHFRTANVSVRSLLQFAYGLPLTQILGGPDWLDSTMFDIDAKSDASADAQLHALPSDEGKLQKQHMLQALLADRFQLKTHQEIRELPVYALVVAKGDFKVPVSKANGTMINSGNGHINVQGSDHTVDLLARELAIALGRVVLDKTGIDGRYDITLRWTPDDRPTPLLNGAPDPNPPPDIFTAIQEQLGLKLESTKGPVSVLVIDHVEMPSEN